MRVKKDFAPITITIETEEELNLIKNIRRELLKTPKFDFRVFHATETIYPREISLLDRIIGN